MWSIKRIAIRETIGQMNDNDLNKLSNISIRGRVAFSLCCLTTLIRSFKIDDLEWEFLIAKLWEYTSTNRLDNWHMELAEYMPGSILEYDRYDGNNFEYITSDEFNRLRKIYSHASEHILEMIDLIFSVGTMELYGKAQKKGKSFEYVEKALRPMIKLKLDIPRISQFEKYEFDKGNGWGDVIKREDVNCSDN